MNLLENEKELEKFVSQLPPLERDELWFMSLSARNKYLTDEERVYYKLGRSEMFSREFVFETNMENFLYVIKVLEAHLTYRTTQAGLLYPPHATMVYFNIEPSSGIKAYTEFQHTMNKEMDLLVRMLQDGKQTDQLYHRFQNCMSILKSCMQKAHSTRRLFIDVDFDTKDRNYLEGFLGLCRKNNIAYMVLNTKSGFHVIMNRLTVHCNFVNQLQALDAELKHQTGGGEIVINPNKMVPLPGSKQAGHVVVIEEVFRSLRDTQ